MLPFQYPTSQVSNYFVPPPYISTLQPKVDLNKGANIRKPIADFFYKKVIKWLTNYKTFKHAKKNLKLMKSEDGYTIVYNLLRKFVKRNYVNWWDLRKENYLKVKDFFRYELGKKL